MKKEYRNYNIFALRGDTETSDADVCQTLGLDPELAGTPQLNEAAINKMYKQNVNGYVKQGYDEATAVSMAKQLADNTRAEIKSLMK